MTSLTLTQTEIFQRHHGRAVRFFWALLIGSTTVSLIGFVPHSMPELKQWAIALTVFDNDLSRPGNQFLEADIVYVRRLDFLVANQSVAYSPNGVSRRVPTHIACLPLARCHLGPSPHAVERFAPTGGLL